VQFNLDTVDPSTIAFLLEAVISVQVPARIDTPIVNGALAAGGHAIVFTPNGSTTPAAFNGGVDGVKGSLPSVTVTWSGADKQPGDIEQVTSLTASGCTVQILNGGVGVARSQVNVFVEGF
jgi:hypothetical protein